MNPFSLERAMTPIRFFAFCGVLAAVGCSKASNFTEPSPPLAGVHFVAAVPDTMQTDFRVVDIPSNAGWFDANFRGSNMFYVGIEAGTRRIKVFLSSTDPAIAQQVLADTTFAYTENTNYTFIHTGFSRTGQVPARAVWIIPDNATAPAADSIGLRFIHAGAGMGSVDLNVVRRATDTLPDVPLAGGVTYGATVAYRAFPQDTLGADSTRIVVTAAGTKTPRLVTLMLPAGQLGTTVLNPIAGARVRGSVMTAVVVPASVVGSQAPQGGAFATPSAVILVDRRPPNTVP
jgi:hypothetical protein